MPILPRWAALPDPPSNHLAPAHRREGRLEEPADVLTNSASPRATIRPPHGTIVTSPQRVCGVTVPRCLLANLNPGHKTQYHPVGSRDACLRRAFGHRLFDDSPLLGDSAVVAAPYSATHSSSYSQLELVGEV